MFKIAGAGLRFPEGVPPLHSVPNQVATAIFTRALDLCQQRECVGVVPKRLGQIDLLAIAIADSWGQWRLKRSPAIWQHAIFESAARYF
jgi:hypothetical protein